MSAHKAYCLLSSGTLFAHVGVNSHDGISLAQAQSQLQFEVSVTEHKDAVKARMVKSPSEVDWRFRAILRLRAAFWLVGRMWRVRLGNTEI
jgi:hypothetical protein